MAREIERKFLFTGDINQLFDDGEVSLISKIKQGYLSNKGDGLVVRVRTISAFSGEFHVLTIKRADGGEGVIEHEFPITEEVANELFKDVLGTVITKVRYDVIIDDNTVAEIDIFRHELDAISWVEIEVPSLGHKFEMPSFCGKEITNVAGISNFNMSVNPQQVIDIFMSLKDDDAFSLVDHKLIAECKEELGLALSQFGKYTFDDKGPNEVMELRCFVNRFRSMNPQAAAETLVTLAKDTEYDGRCEHLVTTILNHLDDWDELWEVKPDVSEYY